jgi:hypothetical protein
MCLFTSLPASLLSQAWLSPKGEGTVSVLYQYGFDRLHYFSDGRTKDRGHVFLDSVLVDADFSIADKLAINVSLPYVGGKYLGSSPHQSVRGNPGTAVALDNGTFHATSQDFRFDVRYKLSERALNIVPFFEAVIPSHSYATLGHAAVGLDVHEYRIGVNLGRRLNPILPKGFVQGRYAFGFSEKVANIAPKRSYAELQLGYFLTRRISLQGAGILTYSHNGIDHDYNLFPDNLTDEQWLNHDRISRANLVDIGANIGYSFNRSTTLTIGAGHSVWGENTHMRTAVVSVGFVKAFSTGLAKEEPSRKAFLPEGKKALVCTCAKTK